MRGAQLQNCACFWIIMRLSEAQERLVNLNLPILERVADCKNLLIAGMGGGFDIFCGLPIYFELRERGMNVHLANHSFSHIGVLRQGIRLSKTLLGVNGEVDVRAPYFPEQHLVAWFRESHG